MINIKFNVFFFILIVIIYVVFIGYIIETHIDLPEGSWKDLCNVLSWTTPYLTTECMDLLGRFNITTINVNECSEIELDPIQTEKRHEGINLEHKHYPRNKGTYFHIHKLINDNGTLKCDTINIAE
jgi:hypothetical protein